MYCISYRYIANVNYAYTQRSSTETVVIVHNDSHALPGRYVYSCEVDSGYSPQEEGILIILYYRTLYIYIYIILYYNIMYFIILLDRTISALHLC